MRIPLTRPSLGAEEAAAVAEVLASGMLVSGPRVAALEALAAAQLGGRVQAVAVQSGTAALEVALRALDVGPGDEVVVPDFCFPSVAAAVHHTGAVPVLCDVDPDTFNLDLPRIQAALGPRTRAVIAVDQFGIPCGAGELARALSVPVIEDAACAFGAPGCGTGETPLACFSFHPRKLITTAEGGLVTTADPALAERCRWLRNHGMRRGPAGTEFAEIGLAGRMSDVHAAIGVVQLGRLQAVVAGRAAAAARYREALAGVPGLRVSDAVWHPGRVYQSLVVRVAPPFSRDRVVASLRERGIESTIGTYAIHSIPAFARVCRVADGGVAGSVALQADSVTLPLWPEMPASDVEAVAEALNEVLVA